MNINKIKSYVGFAIKSKSIVFGVDSIKEKKTDLIIYASSLADSSKQKCMNIAEANKCKYFELSDEIVESLVNSSNIKAFAIKNKELAKAIINNI